MHLVKYEDLVDSFDEESRRLSEFLEVDNEFTSLAAPVPDHLADFQMTSDQIETIEAQPSPLTSRWRDMSLDRLITLFPRINYSFGTTKRLRFGREDDAEHALRRGFCDAESWGAWTSGTHSEIAFKSDKHVRAVALKIRPFFDEMQLFVSVNGSAERTFRVGSKPFARYSRVDLSVVPPAHNVIIRLRIMQTKTSDHEPMADHRPLGLAFRQMRLFF